jgi:hypothetical protein
MRNRSPRWRSLSKIYNRRNKRKEDSEAEIKSALDDLLDKSSLLIRKNVNKSMVEIDEAQLKWGQGFIENIEIIVEEFVM